MSITFQCPSCGGPLEYNGGNIHFQCPYCSSAVTAPQTGDTGSQAGKMQQIKNLAAGGNLIEAIKQYREMTGAGLREAKEAVEALAAGQVLPDIPSRVAASSHFNSNAEVMDNVKRLLRVEKKIEAVKVYREYFSVGLKEAKDAVDQIETDMKYSGAGFTPTEPANSSTFAPSEPVMSANPFDESQKPSSARRWLVGCGLATAVFCLLCGITPLIRTLIEILRRILR